MAALVIAAATAPRARTGRKKWRRVGEAYESANSTGIHELLSSLLVGKRQDKRQACLKNVAPFWALLRAPTPSAPVDMELDVMALRDFGGQVMEVCVCVCCP